MKFLLIDGHPLVLEGYVSMLRENYKNAVFCQGHNLVEVIEILSAEKTIDMIFMDCNIGGQRQMQMNNGIEWIRSIKQIHVNAKVVLITSHKEILSVYQIHKKVFPDGLLVKSDASKEVLCLAVKSIIEGNRFYSAEVVRMMDEMSENALLKEHRNIEILTYLSLGYKVSDISDLLFISDVAVYKRISLMKKNFNAIDSVDLVKIAIQRGFV